jgi:hypothetical protein
VTGGSGKLGRPAVEHLIAHGYAVSVQGSRTVSWDMEAGVQYGGLLAEPRDGADCQKSPHRRRSRPRQRLIPGVDMTSDVKGWEQLFYVRIRVFSFCLSEEPEPVKHDG